MAITFREVWQAAAFRADLSVNGVGPHLSERITDPEWRSLLNDAINHAWAVATAARPDFRVTFQDFTVISGGSASFAVPSNFYDLVDVVYGPDTTSEYSLGPYAWQNRRAPGGWGPPYLTGVAIGGSGARLMGDNVYIEPSTRAGGIYRCWYCPKPKLVVASFTCRLATAAALPVYSVAGAGPTRTLTGNVNGLLSVDGSAVAFNDLILVKNAVSNGDNGIYVVNDPGSGGAPYKLIRTAPYDTAAGFVLAQLIYVSAGAVNVDLFYEISTAVVTIDVSPVLWVEGFIDSILEPRVELLKIKTAIPAVDREDDLTLTQLNKDLTKLEGQFATYLKQVRTANGPQKIIDTDMMGPRGWGW